MPSIKVYSMKGEEVGTMELSTKVFGADYNEALIHQAVVTRLANERQGTKGTLTRSEVRGGGKKPWRQKGTGRARQGSIRAPQWIKGGVVFAPKSRDFSKDMNKKAKTGALISALSTKLAEGNIIVVDSLTSNGKTSDMVAFKKALNIEKSAVVVMDNHDELVIRAAKNIPSFDTLPVAQISTYEVVAYNTLVLTQESVKKIEEVYGE